ncbi:ABC transporter substrate-binding protein [Pseudohalocynthiibacter aestuariivivens]|jgi:peptide/nickel transport system substrate-binding protein|uniref:ABC transporter substrate-binding protein n=1 Tax=Pseudohalocynthiibacter aestuariivivens TaxID=1591409 RepID=A0ABV5JJV0_9RHOB|nr:MULTISPECIES: ABC transporter substrate-binding protein [Pseudohalocynthiibacter]MBS9717544.1 ABC transporter substrate-binding protein [Pseudohalocynthiibacter aestuariivivens]MCK0102729.1 ABC transporter substrate-binding protein [Pseudohalocynthiibacter sp. F2068]
MNFKALLMGATWAIGLALSPITAIAQNSGGNLVYLVQPEPPSLASFLSTSGPIGLVAPKIYDGLFDYDTDLQIVPSLAESYEVSEDGKTVTFKLRQGVVWHDGAPFTSADVAFTVMDVLKQVHPRGPNSFREVTSIDTPDDYTAVFNLENPAPYMLRALSVYESPMVPKHLLEGQDPRNSDLATNPVGTGPFRFVEWRKGQYIRLDKNENYWKPGLPLLDRIVGRFIPDASTRTAAMENGEVMYGAYGAIPNIDAVRLREMDGFSVTTDGYAMINPMALIEFNTTKPPFDNPAMRRAVSLVMDRQFLIDNIWFGYGKPATSALSSNFDKVGLYRSGLPNYPATGDLEAAIKELDDAGIMPDADGVRASITLDLIPYGEDWRRAGEYMKQAMKPLGIEVELRYEDVPTWLNRIYAEYDFEMNVNYFYQLPDPVLGVHRHYGTDQIRQGTHFVNSSRYSNPELDALLAAGAQEPDATKRAEIYGEIQEILATDMPVANLFEMEFLTVYNDKLADHATSAMGAYGPFENASITE